MTKAARQFKRYPLHQSPLYKLNSRRKLAELFGLPLIDLERLARRKDNYRVFTIGRASVKSRQVEVPKARLERIHRRIFNLLSRVAPPPYLHSGIKGKSYITNARAHLGSQRLITLDIRSFFPSTLGWHVFEFFHEVMKCSRDVAGLLTTLVTYDNHIPTGSCVSQLMAFYAHCTMFDEIYALANSLGLSMTCYVDDIAISGNRANRSTLYKVRGILKRRGLQSPSRKERVYDPGYPKLVTGSVIYGDELRLPNKKHKRLHEEIKQILSMPDSSEKLRKIIISVGRAVAASQSDTAMEKWVGLLNQEKMRVRKVLSKPPLRK